MVVNKGAVMRRPVLLFALFFPGGCASLSENECRTASREQIGYNDGVRGAARSREAAPSTRK
jgi:hypothetical protein